MRAEHSHMNFMRAECCECAEYECRALQMSIL